MLFISLCIYLHNLSEFFLLLHHTSPLPLAVFKIEESGIFTRNNHKQFKGSQFSCIMIKVHHTKTYTAMFCLRVFFRTVVDIYM